MLALTATVGAAILAGINHTAAAFHPAHRATEVSLALVDAAGTAEPIASLLQYGVLGLVVVGFITGWIVPGPTAKALAVENARLSALIEGKLFPMLEQYAANQEKSASALERSAEAMDRVATIVGSTMQNPMRERT